MTRIAITPTPPRWAEAVLRLFLAPTDFATVSGDLLEAYRDTMYPARGPAAADAWYSRQVLGFVARSAGIWAVLFGGAFVTREVIDALAPPLDYHFRSAVTTYLAIGLLLAAGLWTSVRSGSPLAGTLAGVATTAMAAVISILGAACFVAVWHDARTIAAIDAGGGLGEVFTLPVMMIVPGAVLGTVGGLVGAGIRRLRPV